LNAGNIADVSPIPGSSSKVSHDESSFSVFNIASQASYTIQLKIFQVVVIERNGFPGGHMFPAPRMPANKLCVVDLYDLDEKMVMQNKKCVLNYHAISDPWDVDNNGVSKLQLLCDIFCVCLLTKDNFISAALFLLDLRLCSNSSH